MLDFALPARKLIGVPLLLCVAGGIGGLVYAVVERPVYRVESELIAKEFGTESTALSLLSGNVPSSTSIVAGLFQNDALTQHLSKSSGLKLNEVKDAFGVAVERDRPVIRLTVDHPKVEVAKKLLTESIQFARTTQSKSQLTSASQSGDELKKVLDEKQAAYLQMLSNLADEISKNPVPTDGSLKSLASLRTTLTATQSQRIMAQAKAAELKSRKSEVIDKGQYMQSPFLEDLRQQVAAAQTAVDEVSKQLGPENPKMIEAVTKLSETQKIYDKELNEEKRRLSNGFDLELRGLETQIQILKDQESTLSQSLRAAGPAATKLSALQRDLQLMQTNLGELRAQFEVARIEQEVVRIPWTVLSEPTAQEKPINKRVMRYPAGGGLIGFFVGVLILAWQRGMRSQGE